MIKTVFLDMDGVMVNFLGGLHRSLGVPYDVNQYPYEKGKWNMLTDIKGFDDVPATFEQCNDACTRTFWANLEWMPDGVAILRAAERASGRKNIWLLTTPMPNTGSASGKIEWINKYLPWYSKKVFITTASKSVVAGPDTLLIDDKDENVNEFREAGGRGLLVPRPWNADYGMAHHTLEVVCDRLEDHLNAG